MPLIYRSQRRYGRTISNRGIGPVHDTTPKRTSTVETCHLGRKMHVLWAATVGLPVPWVLQNNVENDADTVRSGVPSLVDHTRVISRHASSPATVEVVSRKLQTYVCIHFFHFQADFRSPFLLGVYIFSGTPFDETDNFQVQ